MSKKLKPCPFCGYKKPFLHFCEYRKSLWIINCPKCKMELTVPVLRQLNKPDGGIYDGRELSNKDRLIEAWNRRIAEVEK